MFTLTKPLVLASASPRRRDLLAEVGIFPEILPADGLNGFVEPSPDLGEAPHMYAMRAAQGKARVVSQSRPGCVVLAADTIVVLPEPDGPVVLGKPKDIREALHMLRRLNGVAHQVVTACCLTEAANKEEDADCEVFHVVAEVEFLPWPDTVLAAYARTGEGLDKAGAYAIQGKGGFLTGVMRGSWSNVVGLPVAQVLQRLMARGLVRVG